MRTVRHFAMALFLSAAPAWAAEGTAPETAPAGTAEGAKAIIEGLAPYLGRQAFDGAVVKVEPDPAGYRITLDPKSLLQGLEKFGLRYEASPYSVIVSRRDDGNWNYFANSPLDIAGTTTRDGIVQTLNYDFADPIFKGIYSPSLGTFVSGKGSIERFGIKSKDPQSSIDATFGRSSYEISGKPAADGAADIAIGQTVADFAEKVTIVSPGDAGTGESHDVNFGGASMKIDTTVAAARMRPLLDLYAFFVSHPEFADGAAERAKLAASQDELKARLRAVLPLWDRIAGIYDIERIKIDMPAGGATLDRLRFDFGTDGISRDTSIDYRFGVEGLKVASAMLPAWSQSLIPTDVDLDFAVKKLDLQTPVGILIDDLDLARDDSQFDEIGSKVGQAFDANPPTFVIEPSRLKSRDLDLGFSGSMAFAAGKPSATVTVEATGLDRTIENLKTAAADAPEVNQFVGGLSMAKGFGKTLPDGRVQWVIDAASDGSVKVNGFEIKSADPVAMPDAADDGSADEEGIAPDGEAPTDDNALPDATPQ